MVTVTLIDYNVMCKFGSCATFYPTERMSTH